MPIFEIQGKDGKKYEIEAADQNAAISVWNQHQSQSPQRKLSQGYDRGALGAATEGLQSGTMMGWDPVIAGGMMAPIEATKNWLAGEGFDLGKGYRTIRDAEIARKAARREAYPTLSTVGEITGAMGTGGGIAKNVGTIAGRGLLPAMAEGAAYGGVYGAGEAAPGERLEGAAWGGLTGAGTTGVLKKTGDVIAGRAAARQVSKARKGAEPVRSAEELSSDASDLFEAFRGRNVRLPAKEGAKAVRNIDSKLAETNPELSPTAFALRNRVADVMSRGDVDIAEWHNLSKQVNRVSRSRSLQGEDEFFIGEIKRQVDGLRDARLIGRDAPKAVKEWRRANELTMRQKKVEAVDQALDFSDIDTGQYTQAQLASTISRRFRQLYKRIKKGQEYGFSKAETEIIRQIGKGKSTSSTINLLRKLAPRGVVSAAAGQLLGSLFPGGWIITPAVGETAQRIADRSVSRAAQTIADDISRGIAPVPPQLSNRAIPMLPGVSGSAGGQLPRRYVP